MNEILTYITNISKPCKPIFAFRPHTLSKAVDFFLNNFKGRVLYAVKTNPEHYILKSLYNKGIVDYDIASLDEIVHVRSVLPQAVLYFMNPVKSRDSIAKSYYKYGVRHFALDSRDELYKILHETCYSDDLCLYLRILIPNTYAELNLSEKFGINLQESVSLLQMMSQYSNKLGVCFHVGSQCMHPQAYGIAIDMARQAIVNSGVSISYLDVGGGFPQFILGWKPPGLLSYFNTIYNEFCKLPDWGKIQLLGEPGRALVAESTSLIVRVELRKNNILYINDGTYGSLFDAGSPKFIFPVRLLSYRKQEDLIPFSFYGPTCDSIDFMKGPFYLPKDIHEGDYIEIGQMGAYAKTMASNFNSFSYEDDTIWIKDEPLMSMYNSNDINHIAA